MSDALQPRDGQFNVRVSESDRKRLEWLRDHYNISLASVIRMLIKKEHDRLTAAQRPRASRNA
jgi:hypothetical protein